jgi:dipeptidyl aminopeptidase/acylaminoacyl peptidase
VSPEGDWIAYTVNTIDREGDKSDTDVWMVRWDGSVNLRLTTSKESETSPRWSPDGKWLAFLSSRGGAEAGAQVWVLNRQGGEAQQLTSVKGSVGEFAWSPDSKRLALVVREKAEEPKKEGDKPKTAKPIEINRYRFKLDGAGYLTRKPEQIWLFTVETKKAERLTAQTVEEGSPVWSPDGTRLAFWSNQGESNGGRYAKWQMCTAEAKPGASVTVVSTDERIAAGRSGRPVWGQDGKTLFFLAGREAKYRAYNRLKLGSVALAGGGTVAVREPAKDRSLANLQRLSSGELGFLVVDDMTEYPVKAQADGSGWTRLLEGSHAVSAWSEGAGHVAVLVGSDDEPSEIHALQQGRVTKLTKHNAEWRSQVKLGATREVRFRTKDNVQVSGLLTLPPDYVEGKKIPLLLRIHGGPNGQDAHSFQFERHLFAAHGYAVLQVNYRGSAGREEPFQTAIFADWGNKEVVDLLAGVDHVVGMGIADPNRLGIGGWSYGGILTNYAIAKDTRFKAATSGAGSSLQLSMYGSDQYVEQYDLEVGMPWKAKDLWVKLSYPFFEADKIRTPTLFLGGEKDFNVPVIGSEQMYQALRANDVDSELIIYPGENHGIRKPSYVQHRLERYLGWYGKYLGVAGGAGQPASSSGAGAGGKVK